MSEARVVKVAGYTRISTDEEHQRYSLSAQEERVKEYILSHIKQGYKLHNIYSDQKSATTLDRPALQKLLRDAEKGLFAVILVVKMDRLCRSLSDQLYLTQEFKNWGIKLEAADEDIDLESPEGITWAQIRGAFNESESRKNSYRTKMGMKKKASLGGWCGGYTPLGYSYDEKRKMLVPNQNEETIIKEIFHLYTEKRMGAKTIAVHLNRKGLRTRNGNPFSTSLILSLITNPIYQGIIRWDKKTYPGKHEPLVDKETYDKAQAILSERRGNPSLRRSNSSNYPLSGLLRCQKCGKSLVGVSANSKGKVYQYYACPGRFKYGECSLQPLPKERIDNSILSQIKHIFQDTQLISRILKRVNMKRREKLPKKQTELKSTEREILKKQRIIQKYLCAFEAGQLQVTSAHERVKQIENEITPLEERKTKLEDEIEQSEIQPLEAVDLRKMIGKLDKVILSANPSEKKALLRNIIKTIKVLSHSHIEPYYRIPEFRIMSGLAPRAGLEPTT